MSPWEQPELPFEEPLPSKTGLQEALWSIYKPLIELHLNPILPLDLNGPVDLDKEEDLWNS